ncbi:hypothetical protein [Methyloceanibacter sp.]|jgi:hypothetical protein|uniref:hypothetical protein n=1 Tax=Methyloceanibacter sp. TaxID=1965321 RepID=UPI003C764CB3
MTDDSCDKALEEFNRCKLEVADAFSALAPLAAAFAFLVFVFRNGRHSGADAHNARDADRAP